MSRLLAWGLAAASALLAPLVPAPTYAAPVAAPPDAAVTLTGRILDADAGLPLEFATVSAFAPDSALVTGASTDSTGRFGLVLPKGDYRLVFEFVGYVAKTQTLTVKASLDLGDVTLVADAVALDGATVTAQRSQLSLKLDKQVFDVGADVVSKGGSANEVLQNVPSVDVSPQGVVSLRGKEGVKVLINGKPSTLADNDALASIPADNIARVEVMTTPSAKYEASGAGGIINIVLKDASKRQLGGRVGLTVGSPADNGVQASISGSVGKWTPFAEANVWDRRYVGFSEGVRVSELPGGTETLREDIDQVIATRGGYGRAGFDYQISEATTLGASYTYFGQGNDMTRAGTFDYADGDGVLQRRLEQDALSARDMTYHQAEASASHDFARAGERATALFQYDRWTWDQRETFDFTEALATPPTSSDLFSEALTASDDFLLQFDYERPLGEDGSGGKLETGVRGETRVITSDYLAERTVGGERVTFLGIDDELAYRERIGAAYVQYATERGAWGLQAGLRTEVTYVGIDARDGADETKRYAQVFPSASVSRKLSETWSTSLSYTTRIRRPSFWQLNPFTGVYNPNSIGRGNIDLDPAYTHALEAKALYRDDKLTVAPFVNVNHVDDYFDTYVTQAASGLLETFPINLDREREGSAGLTVSYAPSDDWQLNGETRLTRRQQRGVFREADFANAFTTYSAQGSLRGKLWGDVKVQATVDYDGPTRYAQVFTESIIGIRGGLSRDFLDDKLSLNLTVNNLFGLNRFRGGSSRPGFTNAYTRQWKGETWRLAATWDIGKQVRQRRARGRIR